MHFLTHGIILPLFDTLVSAFRAWPLLGAGFVVVIAVAVVSSVVDIRQ